MESPSHISMQPEDEKEDFTVALNLTYAAPQDSASMQDLRETYQRSSLSLQEAKKRYDDIQDHYRRTLAKNKALKDQVAALTAKLAQQESESRSEIAGAQEQLQSAMTRIQRLEQELSTRDALLRDLQLQFSSPGKPSPSDTKLLLLEEELKKAKSTAALSRRELAISRVQIEEALALGKKRDEQIRLLLRKLKSAEGDAAMWKEELKTKIARVSVLEKKLMDHKSPSIEHRKADPMERKLQHVMKELEDKKGEIELLKEMLKHASPSKMVERQQEQTLNRVHRLNPSQSPGYGYLPKVKASLTPVPHLPSKVANNELWPRDSQRRQYGVKSFLSPTKMTRPLQPEFSLYSPPLELIHKNIMNYTPSELRLPPVEAEETRDETAIGMQSSMQSIGSRSQGRENDSELSPEDL